MLEEYQAQAQQGIDLIEQVHHILSEMTEHLVEQYPEEERSFRMHRAMEAISAADGLVVQAGNGLHNIEWPTEDRPR